MRPQIRCVLRLSAAFTLGRFLWIDIIMDWWQSRMGERAMAKHLIVDYRLRFARSSVQQLFNGSRHKKNVSADEEEESEFRARTRNHLALLKLHFVNNK